MIAHLAGDLVKVINDDILLSDVACEKLWSIFQCDESVTDDDKKHPGVHC